MSTDDLVTEAPVRHGDMRALGFEMDPARSETSHPVVRALMIGIPIALLMWAGIGLLIFRALLAH